MFGDKVAQIEASARKRIRETAAHRLNSPQGHKDISRYLKQTFAQPLQALQTPDGIWTTDPEELDQLIQQAWEPVYRGNSTNHSNLVETFVAKYAEFIYTAPAHPTNPIDPQDLQQASRENPDTAGGLDGFDKRDLRWVTARGFRHLADLLNHIETGPTHRWPTTTTVARAVFLCKNPRKEETRWLTAS